MEDFNSCISNSEVFDLAYRECHYTWSNKSVSNPKAIKLDRALVNESWSNQFPDSYAYFDAPGSSDHSPCVVFLSNDLSPRKTRFIFFSMFTSHLDFLSLLRDAWLSEITPSAPMFDLYQRMGKAKFCCKGLNRRCFSNISTRTKEAFSHLQDVQKSVLSTPTSELFAEEEAARSAWLFLSAAEESFFKQKSRIRWLSEGDSNTRVFHKSVKANLSRNVIHYLQSEEGSKVYDPGILKYMVVQFYSDLLGVENDSVSPLSVEQIQRLHSFRCGGHLSIKMAAIPTDEEIRSALFAFPKNKAPGPDGFTVEFTSAWDLVGSDVISAVKSFFTTSVLPRQVNATVISLIPKVPTAEKLSDFRPISLCNAVYKVISKIIASRLQEKLLRLYKGTRSVLLRVVSLAKMSF